MAKTLLICVVLFSILIVNSDLTDSSPSVGQPCNKVNETVADKEECEVYLICNIDNVWSNRSCSFPFLFSDTAKLCQDFNNVNCGGRREPISPCMYIGESETRCSYMTQRTICQCVNTMDLNFDMCANLSDGLYAWPSRKLSRYYIQCLKGRTLPMICEGSSMVFDFQEKHCLLVYDEVSRLYNHTVLQPETTFADVPPLNIYVTQTRFVNDRYVSLQQSTLGFDFDYLISGAGGNSVGKQTFIPAFSQFIYAALTDGGVTQTNLVQERSLLFQQISSVCVTNTLNSKSEKTLTVFNSYVATSVLALNVDMTQTQFVPEKYTLLQPMGSTISLKPSTPAFGAFKSTSEIYPFHVETLTSYIKKHFTTVPDSAMKTLFPVSNTLISQSSFFITESLSETSETYFDRLSFRSLSQMHNFSPKVNANRGISRQNDPSIFMPPDLIDMETGFSALKSGHQYGYSNTIFIRPDDTEIKVSRYFISNRLSQIPKSSAQNMLSFSLFASTISRYFKIYSSQLNSLPTAILETTVSTTAGHFFIIREESDKGLSAFPLKITSDVSMHSKMSSRYYIKTVDRDISSLDQLGYLSLNPSPKLESSKTTFSTMNFMFQFISTITDSIQPTKANMASKSAPPTVFMKTTEAVKPNVDTIETKMASSEASIFPSNLALSRWSSMSPISMTRDLMRSELILDSSFIPVTPMNFPGLVHKSRTTVMDTDSLLRLFESLHSTRLEYSSSQAVAFEVGGESSISAFKISPKSTPVTYDSQLSTSKLLEISPSKAITWLTTSIISTSSSSVKISQGNTLSLISLTDIISSSAPDASNFQSIESTKSKQNNITKLITSKNDQELNPLNLSNTSFIAVLVASCAGLSFFIMLTTILIIHLRKKSKRKQYLQSG